MLTIRSKSTSRNFAALPKLSPEGYRLLCYRLTDNDLSKMVFGEAVKAFCMFNDVVISENGIEEGYVVVFDMKGIRLAHLGKLQFGPLRVFMHYIQVSCITSNLKSMSVFLIRFTFQEAHPVRLKKICIVHTASFINQVMALIKPLIKSELLGLLHFTTGGPETFFDLDILPEVSVFVKAKKQKVLFSGNFCNWPLIEIAIVIRLQVVVVIVITVIFI
jgi:hypothetical protein